MWCAGTPEKESGVVKAFAVIGQTLTKRVRIVRYDRVKAEQTEKLLSEAGYLSIVKEFEAVRKVNGELV